MDKEERQSIKDYEIRRYHRVLDRLRTLCARTEKYHFVKKYFFNRKIIKETRTHFSILDRLYNNAITKKHK